MDTFEQDRTHYERMIELLSKNLHLYEEQAAGFGDLFVPPFIQRQIEDTRAEIERAKLALQNLAAADQAEARGARLSSRNNLPPRTQLIGREQEVETVVELLNEKRMVIVDGMSGIGKTPLALETAHRLWESGAYEAVIWIWLADMVPALTLDSFCAFIARVLDLQFANRLSVEERPEALRQHLTGRKALLVLDAYDKLDDPELDKFIENLPTTIRVLITSAVRLSLDLDAYSYTLHELNLEQAQALICAEAERLGLRAILNLSEKKMKDLARATSGHPYAIKLSLGQMRQSGLTIEALIRQLTHAHGKLFDHIYAAAWKNLAEESRSILLALMLFAEPCTRLALESVCDLADYEIDDSLAQLVRTSLVSTNEEIEESRIRYIILALTRSYLLSASAPYQAEMIHKKERYVRYFLRFCEENRHNFDRLASDHENIDAALLLCVENEWKAEYIRFARALYNYSRDTGYWEEAIDSHWRAIQYAHELNQPQALGWLCNEIASIHIRKGSPEELRMAWDFLKRAEQVFSEIGDTGGLCGAKGRQARVLNKWGEIDQAIQVGEYALSLAAQTNDRSRMADIQHELGDVMLACKRIDEAERYYRSSKELYESLGNELRVVGRLNDLGQLELARGAYAQARPYLTDSINMARRLHKTDTLVRALIGLAEVEEAENQLIPAYTVINEALALAANLSAAVELKQAQAVQEKILQRLQRQRCIVFDFDNTLADSIPLHVETWLRASERFQIRLNKDVIQEVLYKGLPSEKAAVLLGIPKEMIAQVVGLKRALFQDTSLNSLKLFEHVPEVLHQLYAWGYVLTIATTNSEVMIREILRRSGLDHLFAAIVGQESVKNNKPAPDILYALNQRVGIPLNRFVIVGDSTSDEQMARNAGVPFLLAVMGSAHQPGSDALAGFHDFRQLLGLFPQTTD